MDPMCINPDANMKFRPYKQDAGLRYPLHLPSLNYLQKDAKTTLNGQSFVDMDYTHDNNSTQDTDLGAHGSVEIKQENAESVQLHEIYRKILYVDEGFDEWLGLKELGQVQRLLNRRELEDGVEVQALLSEDDPDNEEDSDGHAEGAHKSNSRKWLPSEKDILRDMLTSRHSIHDIMQKLPGKSYWSIANQAWAHGASFSLHDRSEMAKFYHIYLATMGAFPIRSVLSVWSRIARLCNYRVGYIKSKMSPERSKYRLEHTLLHVTKILEAAIDEGNGFSLEDLSIATYEKLPSSFQTILDRLLNVAQRQRHLQRCNRCSSHSNLSVELLCPNQEIQEYWGRLNLPDLSSCAGWDAIGFPNLHHHLANPRQIDDQSLIDIWVSSHSTLDFWRKTQITNDTLERRIEQLRKSEISTSWNGSTIPFAAFISRHVTREGLKKIVRACLFAEELRFCGLPRWAKAIERPATLSSQALLEIVNSNLRGETSLSLEELEHLALLYTNELDKHLVRDFFLIARIQKQKLNSERITVIIPPAYPKTEDMLKVSIGGSRLTRPIQTSLTPSDEFLRLLELVQQAVGLGRLRHGRLMRCRHLKYLLAGRT